jgi:hypothetical protein
MVAFGWPAVAQVWASALAAMALIFPLSDTCTTKVTVMYYTQMFGLI